VIVGSFGDFAVRMDVRSKVVKDNADRLVRKVALAADQAIVTATPVDTGRARSNWIAQVDSPSTDVIPAYVQGKGASTAEENTAQALQQGSSAIAEYNGDRHRSIVIANNLPYIERLNDGWSAQAPANFVEEALADVAKAFDGTVLTVNGGVK